MRAARLKRRQEVPPLLASLLIVALVLLHVLAGSFALHKQLHCEASAPDHHCVVSLIAQGQVSLTDTSLIVSRHDTVLFDPLPSILVQLELVDYRLLPGRAPPSPRA